MILLAWLFISGASGWVGKSTSMRRPPRGDGWALMSAAVRMHDGGADGQAQAAAAIVAAAGRIGR